MREREGAMGRDCPKFVASFAIVKRQCITIFIVFIPGNKKINGMSRVLATLGNGMKQWRENEKYVFFNHCQRSAQFQNRFAM